MTEKNPLLFTDMTQSISIDPSALLTTSTINGLHFPDLTTSGISDSGVGRPTSFILDGVGMCESMTESFCSVAGQDESLSGTNTNGLQLDTSITNSLKNINKKDSINAQRKRRSRKAQYDASVDGLTLDKIESVNVIDESNEADETWLFPIPGNGMKKESPSDNIYSWVHKEFKENDINATKHRLLCKLDDMSHARTIRSISCHTFAGNQRSDSVKRSATEQQVNPGINFDETKFILHANISSTDLLENALYLTEFFTLSSTKNIRLSTLSLDSIDKESHEQFDLFLYDSLNDASSDDDDDEQFHKCSNNTFLLKTIANERQFIEQLTRRCSSLDSLDNNHDWSKPVINGRMISPLRTATPLFNGNGNTRPTSPASSSPLRHTIAATSTSVNYASNTNIHSREGSREREREPLDYTDLEVIAKVQLENLRQAERQGPLSKRFGGSSNTLLSTDSRDVSPSSAFGATRNTSPANHSGYLTPRRIPIRKNSFVVTESQYTHVLPSVSPRSSSPAIRTGQLSGHIILSALETCMEASLILSNDFLLPNNADHSFADSASGGSNVSLASTNSTTSLSVTNQQGHKPPVVPKSIVAKNGVKPNNHRRSNTQTISTNPSNSYDLPDASDSKPLATGRVSVALPNSSNNTNRTRPPVSRPLQSYRGSQTSYNNTNNNPKVQSATVQKNGKKPTTDLGSTFTAKQFPSTDNGLLNDVSNKPRSQVAPSRRISTQSSVEQIPSSTVDITRTATPNGQTGIPRSSSTLSQGRRSGIPTIGRSQKTNAPAAARPTSSNVIPSSQSSDNMMVTRNIRAPTSVARPQIPDTVSPTSSWNEGCY